jgi:hypothetical protein
MFGIRKLSTYVNTIKHHLKVNDIVKINKLDKNKNIKIVHALLIKYVHVSSMDYGGEMFDSSYFESIILNDRMKHTNEKMNVSVGNFSSCPIKINKIDEHCIRFIDHYDVYKKN